MGAAAIASDGRSVSATKAIEKLRQHQQLYLEGLEDLQRDFGRLIEGRGLTEMITSLRHRARADSLSLREMLHDFEWSKKP
jgi:hypothetical protein